MRAAVRRARTFTGPALGPFGRTHSLTEDQRILAVETPGHMPGHMSIVVRSEEMTYFLAGDATYDEELFMARTVEGPQPTSRSRSPPSTRSASSPGSSPLCCCRPTTRSPSTVSPSAADHC